MGEAIAGFMVGSAITAFVWAIISINRDNEYMAQIQQLKRDKTDMALQNLQLRATLSRLAARYNLERY